MKINSYQFIEVSFEKKYWKEFTLIIDIEKGGGERREYFSGIKINPRVQVNQFPVSRRERPKRGQVVTFFRSPLFSANFLPPMKNFCAYINVVGKNVRQRIKKKKKDAISFRSSSYPILIDQVSRAESLFVLKFDYR